MHIAIIGASGYTGCELFKILNKHKNITNINLYGYTSAGKKINDIFPELENVSKNLDIKPIAELSFDLDLYFLALPHGKSMTIAKSLLKVNKFVIDLSADFRIKSNDLYEENYGVSHECPEYLQDSVYGLADYNNADVYKKTTIIANPGCYPTSTILALKPLIEVANEQIISISTMAYSGTSGAGKTANEKFSLSEMYSNVKAYSVLNHRHQVEIEQAFGEFHFPYSFTTHLLPINRGIYTSHSIFLKDDSLIKNIISH